MSNNPTPPNNPTPAPTVDDDAAAKQNDLYALLVKSNALQEKQNQMLKQRSEILSQSSELYKSEINLQNTLATAMIASEQTLNSLLSMRNLENDAVQEQLRRVEELNGEIENGKLLGLDIQNLLDERSGLTKEILENENDLYKLKKDEKDLLSTIVDGEQTLLDILMDTTGTEEERQKRKVKALEQSKAINKDLLALQRKIEGMSQKTAKNFGMTASFSDTLLGSTMDTAERIKQMSAAGKNVSEMFSETFGEAFNLKNILGNVLEIIIQTAIEADNMGKAFSASTGIMHDTDKLMVNVAANTVRLGVTMQEVSQGVSALQQNFSSFETTNDDLNEKLATGVITLTKIGVGASEAAKTMDHFNKVLGFSATASLKMTTELATMGDQMGVSASKMISDFESVSSNLAIYGSRSMDVFQNMAAQAKATGMSVSELVGVAEQFNTFDKAADSAAKLNAVLGTQLSTIDMMNMDHDERIEYLRQEVSMSVGNFSDLDKYTQQYIAQAMGMKDVAQAGRLLGMSSGDLSKYNAEQEASKKTQEELAEATASLVPIMKQFELATKQLAMAFSPVILSITGIINGLGKLNTLMGGLLYPTLLLVIPVIITIAGGMDAFTFAAFRASIAALEFGMAAKMAFGFGGALALFMFADMIKEDWPEVAMLLEGAAIGLFAFGVAMKFAQGKTALYVGAIAALIGYLGIRFNPYFYEVFAFMAVGVLALGLAFQFVSTKGLLAALAFAALFGVLGYFFGEMSSSGTNLIEVALGLALIGLAIAGMGMLFSNPLVVGGALIFMGILLGIGTAMMMMGVGVDKLANGFEKIKSLMSEINKSTIESFVAINMKGGEMSAVVGNMDVMKGLSGGKVTVDVNIPKIDSPSVNLSVYIDGKALDSSVMRVVGGSG